MTAPIDYASMVGDPFANVAKGYQFGAALVAAENQRLAQQQIAAERNRFFSNPNPTMRDAMQFASLLPTDQANALRPYIENYSKEQQQNVLKFNGQVLSAMQTNPAYAIKLLRTKGAAERNAGDTDEADLYDRIATAMEDPNQGPAVGFKSLASITAALPGAKEMFANYSSISAQQTDEAFKQLMAGANTVEDVLRLIPQVAKMGEKGVDFAIKLLSQKRLLEDQEAKGLTLEQQRQDAEKENRQAAAVLKAVFGPDSFSVGEQVKTPSQAAGAEQPPVAEAEGEVGTIAQKERPIMVATAGQLDGLLALRPTKKFIEAVGKGEVQITPQHASVLGLDEKTTTLIRSIAANDPETAADMITTALKMKIKAQTAQKRGTEARFEIIPAAERQQLGLPAGIYQRNINTGEIKPVGGRELVKVSVGDKHGELALKELDIPRAQEFSAAAASARVVARDSRVIADLLKGKGGGATIKLTADFAKTLGFSTETVSANDLANSLAIRGATQMRAPGSGSTSDLEFKSFVSAFPSLASSEGGRELMAKYADLFSKRSAKLADHARKLIREDRYTEEEMGRFDENLGEILGKDFYSGAGAQKPAAAPAKPQPKIKVDF